MVHCRAADTLSDMDTAPTARPDRSRALRTTTAWSAVYLVSQANIARALGSAAPKLLRLQTARSAAGYRAVLAGMTADERAGYRAHYPLDMIHPAIYAAALRAGAELLDAHRPQSARMRRALALAPVVSAAGDYVENVVGWYLLDHPEAITDTRVRATSAVSTVKWALALGQLAYLGAGLAQAAVRSRR